MLPLNQDPMEIRPNIQPATAEPTPGYNQVSPVPLIVFDIKGIPAARRERIVAAVEAGGTDLKESYEAWITSDPFTSGVRVLITGPFGFERTVQFGVDEDSFEITEMVRATLEE